MTTLYEHLGVTTDATDEEIKKAFRKKARDSHPDMGGDGTAFQNACLAKKVLTNKEARERYDKTGEYEDSVQHVDPVLAMALQILNNTVVSVIRANSIGDTKPLVKMSIQQLLDIAYGNKRQLGTVLNKAERVQSCYAKRNKSDEPDYMGNILRSNVKEIQDSIDRCDKEIEAAKKALSILDTYV